VEVNGNIANSLVFSCGDITLRQSFVNCLIIARGTVTCDGVASGCQIIAGKAVHCDKKLLPTKGLAENENNPFGFIRWADAPRKDE
jgi:hypothetical protein